MKKLKTILISSIILSQSVGFAYSQDHDNKLPLTTDSQKLGYALGMEMGKSLIKMNPKIEIKSLLDGVEDAYLKRPFAIDKEDADKIKKDFRNRRIKENETASKNARLIKKELKKSDDERARVKPVYQLDMSMVDQTSPKNAAWSFAILYNDIMPVFTEDHLDKICLTMASTDFMDDCNSLLQNRLNYLKRNIKAIKKAIFSNPKFSQNSNNENNYDLSWDETFTSPDDKQTVTHKKLTIQVNKDNKWKISRAHFSQ